MKPSFEHIVNGAMPKATSVRYWGEVIAIESGVAHIAGLNAIAKIGDRIVVENEQPAYGEIVAMREDMVLVMPDSSTQGMAPGDRANLCPEDHFCPSLEWLGGVIDSDGRLMGRALTPRGDQSIPIHMSENHVADRRGFGARVNTSVAAFDTFLPLCRGQRVGLFAGSGVGKTSLLGELAAGIDADIVIMALIGERSREVREFVDRVMASEARDRTIIFASTCDEPAPSKRRCAFMAMACAEYFRDQGLHVLVLFDSFTRFADAHREIALTAGETPSLRAYPPSTFRALAGLAERTGPGAGSAGDITAIFTVLVAGSDMEEPIADMVRGILDGHVVLERSIAERGRYPAIDIRRSVSRSLPHAASEEENVMLGDARRLISAYEDAETMIQAGLYAAGSDPLIDRAIAAWPHLEAFVTKKSEDCAQSYEMLAGALSLGAPQAA